MATKWDLFFWLFPFTDINDCYDYCFFLSKYSYIYNFFFLIVEHVQSLCGFVNGTYSQGSDWWLVRLGRGLGLVCYC